MSHSTQDLSNYPKRTFRVKLAEGYKYKNVALILQISMDKMKATKNPKLVINGVEYEPTEITKTKYIFNFKDIRESNRSIVFPEDEIENNKHCLEATFVYNGLSAISFFPNPTNELLQNSIFTKDLQMYFKFDKPIAKHIDMEELYVTSECKQAKIE